MLFNGLKIRTEDLEFKSFASNCFYNRNFYGWKRLSAVYSTLFYEKKSHLLTKKEESNSGSNKNKWRTQYIKNRVVSLPE